MIAGADELAPELGVVAACRAVGLWRGQESRFHPTGRLGQQLRLRSKARFHDLGGVLRIVKQIEHAVQAKPHGACGFGEGGAAVGIFAAHHVIRWLLNFHHGNARANGVGNAALYQQHIAGGDWNAFKTGQHGIKILGLHHIAPLGGRGRMLKPQINIGVVGSGL